jgi:hypothetical protein
MLEAWSSGCGERTIYSYVGARDVGNMTQEALDVYVDMIKLRVTQRRQESMSHPRMNTEDVYLVEISGFLVIHVACLQHDRAEVNRPLNARRSSSGFEYIVLPNGETCNVALTCIYYPS